MKRAGKAGIVVLAAAAVLTGGGCAYWYTHPEVQAKYVMYRFLNACMKGDDKGILRYSALRQILPVWDNYDSDGNLKPVDLQAETNANIAGLKKQYSGVTEYDVIFLKPFDAYLKALPDAMREDKAYYEPKSIGLFSEHYISCISGVTESYLAIIRYTEPDGDAETAGILINRTAEGWRADPGSADCIYLLDIPAEYFETETE